MAIKNDPSRNIAGVSWVNYLVLVITSGILMTACWAIGYFGLSFVWVALLIALYMFKTRVWARKEQQRENLRNMILREREFVTSHFTQVGDLPAWVQFPDVERIEWINKIVQQLWPYIGEYTNVFLREYVEPEVRAQMPAPFKSFKFISIDMGDIPCRVGGIKVYTHNVGRDKVIIDMDVVYAGDAEFTVETCKFIGGMNQIMLTGRLRCVLQPLLPYPPMVGGISGSFIEAPKFDFNLTKMGEFVQVPGLIDAIRSIVNTQLASFAVLPNKIVIPLAPNVDTTKLYFPEPDGIIRIKIIEAINLENKDISFLKRDKSDPYVEIKLGSQVFRTRTINNNLNPVFNECFEAVVDQASGQKLRIEVFDEDMAGADDELGRLSIPLEVVRNVGRVEKWYPLEGCKHGDLNLRVSWMDLSSDSIYDVIDREWLNTDKPMHPALLMVFIDNVSNLPYPKQHLEPSPFIEVALGRYSQKTVVKTKTINPLFQSKFIFFVKQPEGQELRIKAYDEGTRRELGELNIPLLTILNQPNKEIYQQTFSLSFGVHSSPIVLTTRLRFFAKPKISDHDPSGHAAGTHSHIERSTDNQEIVVTEHPNKQQKTDTIVQNENSIVRPTQLKKSEPAQNQSKNGTGLTAVNDSSLLLRTPEIQVSKSSFNTHETSSISPSSVASTNTSRLGSSFLKKIGIHAAKMRQSPRSNTPAGQLRIGLRYDHDKFKLLVDVFSGRGLLPIEENGRAEPYVSVRLTDSNRVVKRRTATAKDSLNPTFNAQFDFDIHYTSLPMHKLIFVVKDDINYGLVREPPVLGYVEIDLKDYDSSEPITKWVDLVTL